jgi:P-type Cu+ transporter
MKTIKLKISDMSCASCVNSIESTLNKHEAISEIVVNLMNDTGVVTYDDKVLSEADIEEMIRNTGYEARVLKPNEKNITYRVEGMTCSSCANAISSAIKKLPGILEHHVNVASDKLTVKYNDDLVKISQMKLAVKNAGYTLFLEEDLSEEVDPDDVKMSVSKKRMQKSAALVSIIMTLMIIHMFVVEIPLYTPIVALLAIPIVFILGRHVHVAAYKSLKNLKPNMDVLVSMGSLPPYLIGLLGLFMPITTFVEMAATIMTFHLIGKYLETRAKGKASQAIKKLIELGAKTARILVDGEELEVSVKELSEGDIMVIRPGEKIPTDGIITDGESVIDESIATGESMPVKRKKGDEVIGATINKQGLLKVKVTKIGDDTFLSQVIKLVEACQGSKVPIQEFADKITGIFVPLVMLLTALTFTSFLVFTDFHVSILERMESVLPWVNPNQTPLTLAFITATAVLVIACPCALGLGTPTALMVGSGKGADNGILIRNGEAVQTLKDIKAIAFDKTGTLTYGKPIVTDIVMFNKKEKDLLAVAGAIEKGSEHPLASAIIEKAHEENVILDEVTNF